MEDKWMFCSEHECDYCGKVIYDYQVKDEEVVTCCPFCKRSFVE